MPRAEEEGGASAFVGVLGAGLPLSLSLSLSLSLFVSVSDTLREKTGIFPDCFAIKISYVRWAHTLEAPRAGEDLRPEATSGPSNLNQTTIFEDFDNFGDQCPQHDSKKDPNFQKRSMGQPSKGLADRWNVT